MKYPLLFLFIGVFILHIGAILTINAVHSPFAAADYEEYEGQARAITERLKEGNVSLQGLDIDHYFPVIVGYLSFFFGFPVLTGQILNGAVAAIIALLMYAICREMGSSSRVSFFLALFASLYPSYLLYSSLFLEDTFVILFALAALFAGMKALKTPDGAHIFTWFLFVLLAAEFRAFFAWFLGGAFLVSWLLFAQLPRKPRFVKAGGIALLIFILPFAAEFLSIASGWSDHGHSLNHEFERMKAFMDVAGGFIWSILGPTPWTLEGQKQFFAFVELLPWFLLIPFVVQGIALAKEKIQPALHLAIFALFVFSGIALFVADAGMMMRLRIPALLALFPFVGFSSRS